MKSWFAQVAISEALRRRTPLPRFWRRRIDADPQLSAFERDARELEAQMRSELPTWPSPAPEDLTPAILRTIRTTVVQPRPPETLRAFRWGVPAAALLLVTVALLWPHRAPSSDPSSVTATVSPSADPRLALAAVPATSRLLADMGLYPSGAREDPLAAQLEAASEDARATARFLIASLP